jgi:hypothetical protein
MLLVKRLGACAARVALEQHRAIAQPAQDGVANPQVVADEVFLGGSDPRKHDALGMGDRHIPVPDPQHQRIFGRRGHEPDRIAPSGGRPGWCTIGSVKSGGASTGTSTSAGALGDAARGIVGTAASILEAEVASSPPGGRSPGQPRERFEDLVRRTLGVLARAQQVERPAPRGRSEVLPVVEARGRPGAEVRLSLSLQNDLSNGSAELGFVATDLVCDAERRIPAAHVLIEPPRLHLKPGTLAQVSVRVKVPADAGAGRYYGLLQSTGRDQPRAVVSLTIETREEWP